MAKRQKTPKLGRPFGTGLPDADIRRVVALRLSDSEKKPMDAASRRAGMSFSTWARQILLRESKK